MSGLMVTHAAVTLFRVGVIWTVQILHYPLMAGVGALAFVVYEQAHRRRASWIVLPAMLREAATGLALFLPQLGVSPAVAATGAALLLVIWLSNALVQGPCHGRLAKGFEGRLHRRLVRSNRVRTAAWTARGVLICGMMTALEPA